jgi:hypothetical protein
MPCGYARVDDRDPFLKAFSFDRLPPFLALLLISWEG